MREPGGLQVRGYALVVTIAIMGLALPSAASSQEPPHPPSPPPTPDPNFAATVIPEPCTYDADDPVERKAYEVEGWEAPDYERYPGSCQRMRFAYGPIVVKPGQNDVFIGPVTIEKPTQDGYITRFKPNLITEDHKIPPVHELHLHHGTWLNVTENYGSGPFFASGEEKTIAPFPRGYGMPVRTTDQWQLLYMVHSAVQQPVVVYITYEIDFVPATAPAAADIKPAYPIWLDVRPSGYPVFNTQRKYGDENNECTWPKEQCADFNPWGEQEVGQGQPGNGVGEDLQLPGEGESLGRIESFTGGTLIGIGGHVHPGGVRNEIDLVRDGEAARIYNGIPTYWDPSTDYATGGGRADSWDFSMRVSGLPYWGVHVEPGDSLRSNATYDTSLWSTYENMGIAITLLVPEDGDGNKQAPGLNPFEAPVDASDRCDSEGLLAATPTLCPNGLFETHGHYPENEDRGGPGGEWSPAEDGAFSGETSEVAIADFVYAPGDLSMADSFGIPKVKLGTDLRFTNLDGGAILHTITTCKFPCLGETGAAFPLSNGETSLGRQIDLDSGQLGYAIPEISGALNRLDWTTPVTEEEGYTPGEIVTYYCRIHPSMRGAFEVIE